MKTSIILLSLFFFSSITPQGKHTTRIVTVKNSTDYTIEQIYVTNAVGNSEWSDNLLDSPLASGNTTKVNIDCKVWRVKLVDDEGNTHHIDRVDVCAENIWNIL